ncbi:hypothetical protein K3495_g10654 [Podosphaera aphanis]|nr:hypothetical protein K3495_g10654 [Podosphaera aphanis]
MSKFRVIVPRNDKLRDMISQSSQRSSSRISETPEIDNTVSLEGPSSTHSIDDDIYMEDDEDEDELTERITSPTPHTETIGYNEWDTGRYPINFGEPLGQSQEEDIFEFDPDSYGTYGQKRRVNFAEKTAKKHNGKGLGSLLDIIDGSKECISTARDLLIKAAHQAESRAQQTKILDLLNIFREFLEKDGNLPRDASVLTAQLQRLEHTTQVLQTTARQSQAEWTVVQPKKKAAPKARKSNRVILLQDETTRQKFSPLKVRDKINQAFKAKGVEGPVVAIVSSTRKENLAITTTEPYSAEFFMEKVDIWKNLAPHVCAMRDEPWFKVVIHGVPTTEFENMEDLSSISEEIAIFNHGLKIIGQSYLITPEEKRKNQVAGSVVVAFETEAEAKRAISRKLIV